MISPVHPIQTKQGLYSDASSFDYQENSSETYPDSTAAIETAQSIVIREFVASEAERLRAIQLQRGYKPGWVYFELCKLFDLTEGEIYWLAEFLGFKRGWAWRQTSSHREVRREAVRWGITIEAAKEAVR